MDKFLELVIIALCGKWVWDKIKDNEPIPDMSDNLSEDRSIIIKEPYFNINKIKEYPLETKQFIYRPQTLDEYIGQDKAKSLIRINLQKIHELKTVNFLISGKRGHGKTTLAHIIKNHLNAFMIERIASELSNPDQLVEILNSISYDDNSSLRDIKENIILFIDEIHGLKPKLCEVFYPILEDYKIGGKCIKPFITIGATTEKNELLKKVAPLVDRFQVQIDLEDYTEEDIILLLRQYITQIYLDKLDLIGDLKYKIIAKNCKCNPRIAITLLEDCLIEPNILKVLHHHRIIKDGLTENDFKILKILERTTRPIGDEGIAVMSGISKEDYKTIYEPYLCENGYIDRTSRGRIISQKGKEFINS